jgi:hypothetical protein
VFAKERIAALQRRADLARLAGSRRQATGLSARGGTTMLTEHQLQPGRFDPGHRRDCAREANLEGH